MLPSRYMRTKPRRSSPGRSPTRRGRQRWRRSQRRRRGVRSDCCRGVHRKRLCECEPNHLAAQAHGAPLAAAEALARVALAELTGERHAQDRSSKSDLPNLSFPRRADVHPPLDLAWRLRERGLRLLRQNRTFSSDDPRKAILAATLARSSSTFRALIDLAANGFGPQAGMFARAMIEDAEVACWVALQSDEDALARLWIDHSDWQKLRLQPSGSTDLPFPYDTTARRGAARIVRPPGCPLDPKDTERTAWGGAAHLGARSPTGGAR